MIEKGLEKLGLPAMELAALFIPLLVIIAVLYVTTPPYVDTTMETIKSDIATAEFILPTAEPISVEVKSSLPDFVDEIETIPDSYYEEEKEGVMLTELHDKEPIIMEIPTAEPIVTVDIEEEIGQKVELLRADLTADSDEKLAQFHAKLELMSRKLEETKKSDEMLEQMKQRIHQNDEHIEQLTKRLREKVRSIV